MAALWAITSGPGALYIARRARIRSPTSWILPQYGATVELAAYLSRGWLRSRTVVPLLLGLAALALVPFYDDLLRLLLAFADTAGPGLPLLVTATALFLVVVLVEFGTDARRYLKLQSKVPPARSPGPSS